MDPHSTSSAALQQRLDLLKSNAALRVQLVLREQLETAKHHRHRAANGNASRPEQQLQLLRDTFHSLQHLVTELVSKREVLQAVQHLEKQLVASGVLPPGGKAFTSTTGPTSEASHSELATSARLTHDRLQRPGQSLLGSPAWRASMHEALSSAAYAKGLSLQEGHYGSQQQIARRLGPDNVRSSSSSGQQQQVHQLRMQSYGVPSMQVVSSFNANGSIAIRKLLRTRAPLSSDSSSGSEDAESTAIYALIPQHTHSGHDPASRESGCPGHTTLAASTIGCVLPKQSSQGQTYLRQLHEHPGRVVQYAGGCLQGSLQQQPSPGQGGLGSVPQHSAMAEGEAGSMTAASGEEHSQISTRRRGNGHGCGKGNGAVAGMGAHVSVCFAEGGEDPELLAPAALCTPDMRYLQQLGDVSGAGSHGAGSHGAAASPTASLAGGGEAESLVPLQPYLSMGGGLTVLTPLPEGQAWPETFVYM